MSKRRFALTLVEVLASLVLVASVVSGVVLAYGRSLEQLAATRDLVTASELAQEVISGWQLDSTFAGGQFTGAFEKIDGWSWSRTERASDLVPDPDVVFVHFAVFKTTRAGERHEVLRLAWLEDHRTEQDDAS